MLDSAFHAALRVGMRRCLPRVPIIKFVAAAAHTWQFLSSKINNTSLLSSKDSQKLLRLLTTNFRDEIDKRSGTDGRNLADHHFSSLLASPLFGETKSNPRTSQNTTKTPNSGHFSVREITAQPLECLAECIAGGYATLPVADHLLKTIRVSLVSINITADQRSAITTIQAKAGSLILNWLWSSGQAASCLFLFNRSFTFELVNCLIASKHGDSIYWTWIENLQSRASALCERGGAKNVLPVQSHLLATVTKCIALQKGLPDAARHLLEAVRIFPSLSLSKTEATRVGLLHESGRILASRLLARRCQVRQNGDFPVALYDAVILTIPQWAPAHLSPLYSARAYLFHPTEPTTRSVMAFYENRNTVLQNLQSPQDRSFFLVLGLHAVDIILSKRGTKSLAEANSILEQLKRAFPEELAIHGTAIGISDSRSPLDLEDDTQHALISRIRRLLLLQNPNKTTILH